ncbi:MAG: hypothetical protein AAFW95_04875 [Cyanobacteria bacterium J06638_6]
MRFQWFQDVPRNVTRREYDRLKLLDLCTFGLGALSVSMAIAALTGMTLQTSNDLAEIAGLSIEEAVNYSGDRIDLVKLEGFLVADDAPAMPDDEAQQVIRGQLTLIARGSSGSGSDESAEPLREVLWTWEDAAESVYLSDGDRRLPLAFDLVKLPMVDDEGDLSAEVVWAGESARISQPVAVDYGSQRFPLASETWNDEDSVFVDLERQLLPHGESVVVVAGLESTPQGPQLIDPLGDRLQVLPGTEADIRRQGESTRRLFAVLWVPLAIASFFVGRSAWALRREFAERSNL